MKKTLRTFAAVEITGPIRARAEELIAALDGTTADVKWVEPHNLHLTLKFLGDVHQREIVAVCQAVAQGAAEVEPFEVEVRGAGAFPNAARPRTVWLGVTAGAEPMVVLHDRVEADLAELGYREEHRRFQTHLTIGRVRGAGWASPNWASGSKARRLSGRPDDRGARSRCFPARSPRRPDLRSSRHGAAGRIVEIGRGRRRLSGNPHRVMQSFLPTTSSSPSRHSCSGRKSRARKPGSRSNIACRKE